MVIILKVFLRVLIPEMATYMCVTTRFPADD